MRVYFADKDGKKKPPYFGSYGIGSTRVMGALVEVSHDERGIIWYPQVAPFDAHLVDLPGSKNAQNIYQELKGAGVDVLWDERDAGAGEKFADADLIGIPVRLVVSKATKGKVEWKKRTGKTTQLLSISEAVNRLK